jgi:hypothetical protein
MYPPALTIRKPISTTQLKLPYELFQKKALADTTQFTLKEVLAKHVLTYNSLVVRCIAADMATRMIDKRDGLSFDIISCKNKLTERDGALNFTEFVGIFKNNIQQHFAEGGTLETIEEKLRNGFKNYDKDNNQLLDNYELSSFIVTAMGFDSPEKIRSYKEIQQFQMQFMTQLWQSTNL